MQTLLWHKSDKTDFYRSHGKRKCAIELNRCVFNNLVTGWGSTLKATLAFPVPTHLDVWFSRCKIEKDVSAPRPPFAFALALIDRRAFPRSSSLVTAPLQLLLTRAVFTLCLCASALVIRQTEMLWETDRVLFAITDVFIPSWASSPLFFVMNQVPASVAFPSGYAAVDWEFRGFRQGHSSPGRWRQWRGLGSSRVQERRGEAEEDGRMGREGETVICLPESLKCLAVMLSVLEVSGGMIVLTAFVHRWREKESHTQMVQKLVMQKSTINHRV